MMTSKSFVFSFDDVEVRERDFRLTKAGKVLTVEPKAFRVLLFLLQNPQRVITKEELLNSVWADAAVTEGSLTRCIWLLRSLLGDSSREPRYIETVSTVGYRFVCKVRVLETGSESLAPTASTKIPEDRVDASPTAGLPWKNSRRLWLMPAAVFVAGIGSYFWYVRGSPSALRITGYVQLSHDSGAEVKDPVGTDGPRLYLNTDSYSEVNSGNWFSDPRHVAEMPTTGGEFTRLSIPIADPWLLNVSADGLNLLVRGNVESGLWSFQPQSGSLRHLADSHIWAAAWSPDEKSVAYATMGGDLEVVKSNGTGKRQLAHSLPISSGPAWSPEGTFIRLGINDRIEQISSEGTDLHQLLPRWQPSFHQCCGRWTSDGTLFFFLAWDGPARNFTLPPQTQIWAMRERRGLFRSGLSDPMQLTSGPIRWSGLVPGKDGKTIYARGVTLGSSLVRFDPESHMLQPYLGGISAEGVSFSPDGRQIAYVTYPEGILWRANRDGSNPLQLTDSPLYPSLPRWSPDGTQILFFAATDWGEAKSYLVSPLGGPVRRLLPNDDENCGDPAWSPDGHRIAFDSWDVSGSGSNRVVHEVIRILDLTSDKIETLPGEGETASWSPDGSSIAATLDPESGARGLGVYDLKSRRWSRLLKGDVSEPTWSHDGRQVYFLLLGNNAGVFRIAPSDGQPERVVDLTGFQFGALWGDWLGLDPENAPLLPRRTGSDEVYALSVQ